MPSRISMVLVEPSSPSPRTEAEVRTLFNLTPQEARVAMLLASGLPNSEIARELSISPHTTRHHTERVLLRLGVHSRAQVPAALLGHKTVVSRSFSVALR